MVQVIERTPLRSTRRALHLLKFVHFVHSEMKLSKVVADTVGGLERPVVDFIYFFFIAERPRNI